MKIIGKSITTSRIFTIVSWVVTGVIVLSLLGFAYWKSPLLGEPELAVVVTPPPTEEGSTEAATLPEIQIPDPENGISRKVYLQTNMPDRPQYDPIVYTVVRNDSLFGIAQKFDLKWQSVLISNFLVFKDDPHSLRIGLELVIPPVDGVYYQWEEGDTIESVADKFSVEPEVILDWIGNQLDLTDPEFKPGNWIMIPGGSRIVDIPVLAPVMYRGSSGGGSTTTTCSGGVNGTGGFQWPAGSGFISGNDFWEGHKAIDIAALEGDPVYAADSGVVVRADANGAWNSGYGNVIMIDHGSSGYQTLYAHLSSVNVSLCQSVYAGQVIGAAGNTGNSFGAHLHFEVRKDGGFVNPWYVLP